MGVLAGLAGGAGGGGAAGRGIIAGSGQRLGPGSRASLSRVREPIDPAQFKIQQEQFAIRRTQGSTGARAGRGFQFQQPGEQSQLVRQSQRQAEFTTQDLKRASTNKDFLRQLFSQGAGRGRSGGGRASFLGAGSTPAGARSFPSLLRGF